MINLNKHPINYLRIDKYILHQQIRSVKIFLHATKNQSNNKYYNINQSQSINFTQHIPILLSLINN